jgi:hypothetical protein
MHQQGALRAPVIPTCHEQVGIQWGVDKYAGFQTWLRLSGMTQWIIFRNKKTATLKVVAVLEN